MAFENLLNQPQTELQLLRQLATAVQANFNNNIPPYHYLKLKKFSDEVSDVVSEIIWIKSFDNREDFDDHRYSSKFERAEMAVFLCEQYFKVVIRGFKIFTFAKVFADKIEYFRMVWPVSPNIESILAPPRELIEAGIASFKGEFRRSAKKTGSA